MQNHWLEGVTRRIPLPVYRNVMRRPFTAFLYHLVSDREAPVVDRLYGYKTCKQFEQDLIYLAQNYKPVSYQQLADWYESGAPLPDGAVHLSFDDGLAECFHYARPLLLKYGVPCTFFIITDLIDNRSMYFRHKLSLCLEKYDNSSEAMKNKTRMAIEDLYGVDLDGVDRFEEWVKALPQKDQAMADRLCAILGIQVDEVLCTEPPYMTRDQILQLADDGFTIGAHSCSHPLLSELTRDEITKEVEGSCEIIARLTSAQRVPFAFPHHGLGMDPHLLAKIYAKNPNVGLFFDVGGMRAAKNLVIHRVTADACGDDPGKSNLPELMQRKYGDLLLARLRQYGLYQRR